MDYDSTQVPVLADIEWEGGTRNTMLWANRNGLMYVIDRVTGEFLFGQPYVRTNWMTAFDSDGRPIGGREGYFYALDAETGELLWRISLGGQVNSGPMTYMVDGRQYVAVAAGTSLFAFALEE